MTATEFLIKELKTMYNNFPNVTIRYEVSKATNAHLIEITPFEFYSSDEYIDYEIKLEDSFNEFFLGEEIIFISTESLNKVSSPIFEIYSEKQGHFLADFNVFKDINSFVSFENMEFEVAGENNYALAA